MLETLHNTLEVLTDTMNKWVSANKKDLFQKIFNSNVSTHMHVSCATFVCGGLAVQLDGLTLLHDPFVLYQQL